MSRDTLPQEVLVSSPVRSKRGRVRAKEDTGDVHVGKAGGVASLEGVYLEGAR